MTCVLVAQQKTIPSVKLETLDGKSFNTSDIENNGNPTIISFWATWCKPCKKELNNIAEIYEEWQDNYDVQVIAVSIDDARTSSKVKTSLRFVFSLI